MFWIPARLTVRRSIILLLLGSLLILLLELSPIPLPKLLYRHPEAPNPQDVLNAHYQTLPVYEYDSLYRKYSDKELEISLDSNLRKLEESTRKSLGEDDPLQANKTIWQPHTAEQREAYKPWIEQWGRVNSDWEHKPIILPYEEVFMYFTGIAELAALYDELEVVRRDLLRWLILWYHGGFYVEPDTWDRIGMMGCEPIREIIEGKHNDISIIVGIETDEPFLDFAGLREFGLKRVFGFGTAIIWASKRFDPLLRMAIVRSVSHAKAHLDESIEGLKGRSNRTEDFVEELSGKHMFTDIILETLTDSLKEGHTLRDRSAGLESRVSWKAFTGLERPLWIPPDKVEEDRKYQMRGLAVLPVTVWASGQNHSRSSSIEDVAACVNHAPWLRPPGPG